eukprot:2442615-Alexandrium_andersonii.AAC.1
MKDMVYQGTVFGPPLWNLFFADAQTAVATAGFRDIVYADDLNAYKVVDSTLNDDEVFRLTRNCQAALHRWGAANQ